MAEIKAAIRAVVAEYALALPDAGPVRLHEAAQRLAATCRRLADDLRSELPGSQCPGAVSEKPFFVQQLERAEQEALSGDLEGALVRLSVLSIRGTAGSV